MIPFFDDLDLFLSLNCFRNYSSAATVAATLMNQNVNPNIKNKIGRTALHYAAENGNKDFIRILLMAGLDPHSLGILKFYSIIQNLFNNF